MGLRAVVFDMDGVLVDSEGAYWQMNRNFFADYGLELSDEELDGLAGGSNQLYHRTLRRWWSQAPLADASVTPEEALDRWCARHPIDYAATLFPGVAETLACLRERGLRLALASSSPMSDIMHVIEVCGLGLYFELVVSGADLVESKPDPMIYLQTLARLDLTAGECVAVEDSDPGIASARGAGLRVIARREPRFGFVQEGATWYVDSVPEVLGVVDVL